MEDRLRYWTSPETTAVHRLPMLNVEHAGAVSLDGVWQFQLLRSPESEKKNDWTTIPVPGLWTRQPESEHFWDKPIYTNVQMPWDHLPPHTPELNPTGIYRRTFKLNPAWADKRVVLQIGGFESVAILYVNGREAGMAKDSRLHADFDITDFVKRGTNEVEIKVVKWSDATFVEDQDQWWHGGITRSVMLFATEKVYLSRLYATPGLEADLRTGTLLVRATVASIRDINFTGYTVEAAIGNKKSVSMGLRYHGSVEFGLRVPRIKPWSAEMPNLYDVAVRLKNPRGRVVEQFTQRVGFRDVKVAGRELRVNGQPIILYGINRHDFHRETGRVVSAQDMRKDLLAIKAFNFNAVRTSHYPNDPALLSLADELGLYVIGEANIESHAFYDSLCNDAGYLNAWVDRIGRMVQRDIHHPSVILWSLGNESGFGHNHRAAAAWVRSFDPSRPLHYEGAMGRVWTRGACWLDPFAGRDVSDVVCPMYPPIDTIREYAKSGKGDRPLIMCEYSHAMGNSNGNLKQYWDVIHSTPGLQGGFIWEFWDHGLTQALPDGRQRSAYGGDFGESRHDGSFCCDGIFWPDRTPKPAIWEMHNLAAPLQITSASPARGRFRVFNKNFFTDSGAYAIAWRISVEGDVVESGRVKLPKTGPRRAATISIASRHLRKVDKPGERFITFAILRKVATEWSPRNHEVGYAQFALPSRKPRTPRALSSRGLEKHVGKDGRVRFDFIKRAPALALFRAPTENDVYGRYAKKWEGLDRLVRREPVVTRTRSACVIRQSWRTGNGTTVKHTQEVRRVDGGITVSETIVIPKELDDLPRVGISFEVDAALNAVSYFGAGPQESYPDRKYQPVDRYETTVSGMYVPYIKPQENGGRADVRWFKLSAPDGRTLFFRLDKPRQVSVSPFRARDLAAVTHDVDLEPAGTTVVTIDAAHRGLGTASCGPDTLPAWRLQPGTYRMVWTVLAGRRA